MRKGKAQVSVEFLATYTWAFLIIFVAIGTLYYFGVFDFSKYRAEQCIFPAQFSCHDFELSYAAQEVNIRLLNSVGEDLTITNFDITNDADTAFNCDAIATLPDGWAAQSYYFVNFSNCQRGDTGFIGGEIMEARVEFTYYADRSPSQTPHTVRGKIIGKVLST